MRIRLPYDASTLVKPVHSESAVEALEGVVELAKKEGGEVLFGGKLVKGKDAEDWVTPTLITLPLV
jgi:aldehyde dehydrogenase family 7 protein A1